VGKNKPLLIEKWIVNVAFMNNKKTKGTSWIVSGN
jgi:hypothetical protein